MADVAVPRSQTGNGAATPATAALASVAAGDLLVCVIACIGSTATSIATPTGDSWAAIQNQAGTGSGVPSLGMFFLTNAGSGTHTPSAVLTGTITGWLIAIIEFSGVQTSELNEGSAVTTNTIAQLANVFPTNQGQALPQQLFMYAVARATATISNPTGGLNNWAPPGYPAGASQWSASVAGQQGVQGLSLDFYWGDTVEASPCPFPQGAGLLSSAVNSAQIGAWFNCAEPFPDTSLSKANIGGVVGSYVGPFNAGMVGG